MKEKPLAYFVGELTDGGQEKQLYYLLKEITKHSKLVVLLFVWNFSESQKNYPLFRGLGLTIVHAPHEYSSFQKTRYFREKLKTYQPLILHSYSFYLNPLTWLISYATKTKPLGAIRSSIEKELKTNKLRTLLNLCLPKVIVSNNFTSLSYLKRIWWLKHRVKNIHVVQNRLSASHVDLSQSDINIYPDVISCSIGRIDENKRLDLLIKLIETVNKNGTYVKHYHAGDGVLKDHWVNHVRKKGLENHFVFLGSIATTMELITSSKVFIHTSDSEGSPNVVMEAVACGKAIVTTNCGDVMSFVEHGTNGYVVPKGDINGLVSHVTMLLDNDSLRASFEKESTSKSVDICNMNSLLKNVFHIYENMNVSLNGLLQYG